MTELATDEPASEIVPETKADAESQPVKEPLKEPSEQDAVQKRIDKLTREKYDARRKADLAEYRASEAERRIAALEAKPTAVAQQEPTLESVGYDEGKYRLAMRDWLKAEVTPIVREEAQKTLSISKAETVQSQFDQRQAEYAKSNPDYIETVLERETLPISEAMQDALKQMDSGPQIAHYLCKPENEEKAREIMSLPPLLQAREIGRIEATLEKQKATPPQVSKAPPPPAKIESSDSTVEKDPKDMSDAEFRKWRLKSIRKQRFYTN